MTRCRTIIGALAATLPVVALAGCASMMGRANSGELEALREVTQQIQTIGVLPDAAVMDPAVELVTFSFRSHAPGEGRRDTIRTPAAVAAWLEELHAAQLPDVEFLLATTEVFACDASAVQRGSFRIRGIDSGSAAVTLPFIARWAPDGREGWSLDGLWLDPAPGVRVGALGTGCRSARMVRIESRRFVIAAEAGSAGDLVGPIVSDAMIEAGWNRSHSTASWPIVRADGKSMFTVRASYRMTDRLGAAVIHSRFPGSSSQGWGDIGAPTLSWENQSATAVLGLWTIRGLQVGAGPGLAGIDFHWDGRQAYSEPPVSESHSKLGAVGQISGSLPFTQWVAVTGTLSYGVFPDVETPEYLGLPKVPVPLSRGTLTVGAGVRF